MALPVRACLAAQVAQYRDGGFSLIQGIEVQARCAALDQALSDLLAMRGSEGEALANTILETNHHILEKLAQVILEKETVEGEEFESIPS